MDLDLIHDIDDIGVIDEIMKICEKKKYRNRKNMLTKKIIDEYIKYVKKEYISEEFLMENLFLPKELFDIIVSYSEIGDINEIICLIGCLECKDICYEVWDGIGDYCWDFEFYSYYISIDKNCDKKQIKISENYGKDYYFNEGEDDKLFDFMRDSLNSELLVDIAMDKCRFDGMIRYLLELIDSECKMQDI